MPKFVVRVALSTIAPCVYFEVEAPDDETARRVAYNHAYVEPGGLVWDGEPRVDADDATVIDYTECVSFERLIKLPD